jgi:ribosomal protein S18 acetylase RimI-like enzyme
MTMPINVRRATPSDGKVVGELAAQAERIMLQIPWDDLVQISGASDSGELYDLFLGELDGQLGCVLGLGTVPDNSIAQIRAFVLQDGWAIEGTLVAMLPVVYAVLQGQGVTSLAFIGIEKWFLDGLIATGFCPAETIVTLQKGDFTIPDAGRQDVVVRPARSSDFSGILTIDEAVFDPLWRSTAETLAACRERCPYFVVAELDGKIVGYEYLHLIKRHGHLSRLAVLPAHHGQGIGTRLLAEALAFLSRHDVFGVTLNTQQDNERALRLYKRFGFRILGKEAEVLLYTLSKALGLLATPPEVKYNE